MSLLTIRVEGGLLSPDFLDAVHEAPGQKPADFGLDARRPLIDEIAAVWSDVRTYWEAFERRRARARDGESLTTATREAWVIPLLEALGYSLTYQRKALSADGRSFNISHCAGTRREGGAGTKRGAASTGDGDESGPPVHIVAVDQKLGERPPSGHGTASPHALVQDYLNRSDELWGIVTNGAVLRLLRDSVYFSRPAYIEFDLQAMLQGERLDEFILFYRLAHRSRLPGGLRSDESGVRSEGCLLEQYYQSAVEQGGRIRDGLRQAVEAAILTLGNGFLAHKANKTLRAALTSERTLSPNSFYQQLLYLIYRLIFLMAAEERNLLRLRAAAENGAVGDSAPGGAPHAQDDGQRYADHYSIGRLRRLADAPLNSPQRFDDLYLGLRTLFEILRDETLAAKLAIPALNGELFDPDRMAHLEMARINNRDLLAAVRELSHFTPADEKVRRRVNYAALDVEELGSVYESLLDEHPVLVTAPNGLPQFAFVHGSERKTTGSYYTARELVKETLDSALDTVIEERLQAAAGEARKRRAPAADLRLAQKDALLALRVCDSACGSGHFLLAAARRIGRRLAQVDTSEDEPAPEAVRRWTRQAIIHCIYGVDKNPLAVDLCKVALWIEGHAPGKPLTFLDAHIKCGDALVGVFDLKTLDEGIPDDAFKPVTGDDKRVASSIRARNKQERRSRQGVLTYHSEADALDAVTQQWQADLAQPEDTPAQVRKKRAAYARLVEQEGAQRLVCDLWTAAFFTPLTEKNEAAGLVVTSAVLHAVRGQPKGCSPQLAGHVLAVAAENRFFHWPLEFPHVFKAGGFDVMLGNPPWERIKLQEQEFFAARDPQIATAPKATRGELINALPRTNPGLAQSFASAKYAAEAHSRFARASKRFPLAATGDMNTHPLFVEHCLGLLRADGQMGLIVPTGIATDEPTKELFAGLTVEHKLVSLVDFENRKPFFSAVDERSRFAIITIRNSFVPTCEFAFFALEVEHIDDPVRRFSLSPDEIALFNPNSLTVPIFRTRVDCELARNVYIRVPILASDRQHSSPWLVVLSTMLHSSSDAGLFLDEKAVINRSAGEDEVYPLYEGKMFMQYDHRAATVTISATARTRQRQSLDTSIEQHRDSTFSVQPHYWVRKEAIANALRRRWILCYKKVTSPTNERTLLACLLPPCGANDSVHIISIPDPFDAIHTAAFLANSNCLALDYMCRQKLGGQNLNFYIFKQLPFLPPTTYNQLSLAFIVPRVLELTYTAWDLHPFAADVWAEAGDDLRPALAAQHAANRAATGGHAWNPPTWADLPPQPPESCPLTPFKWDDERRAHLRAELDAYYARLYGLTRDELRYILDPKDVHGPDFPGETFRVLKEKEERQLGEYRTRRLVLGAYDRLEAALGPAPVRDYRAELAAAAPRQAKAAETVTIVDAPDRPQFGAAPSAKENTASAAPPANQPDLFGAPAAPPAPLPVRGRGAVQPAKGEPAAAQPALIPSPPQGTRMQRISRIMALGKARTPEAIGELVAALADEDEQLRWLASMALQSIGGGVVVATLRAYVEGNAPETGRDEARKLLEQMASPPAEGGHNEG